MASLLFQWIRRMVTFSVSSRRASAVFCWKLVGATAVGSIQPAAAVFRALARVLERGGEYAMRRCGIAKRLFWVFTLGLCNVVSGAPGGARKPSSASSAPPHLFQCCEDATDAEYVLGNAMEQQYLRESIPWGKSRLSNYVNSLGQCLVKASGTRRSFTFQVIYALGPSALSVPGGYIFINSGTIERAESEEEIAALLAHEIARVNACLWCAPLAGAASRRSRKALGLHLAPKHAGSQAVLSCTSLCHGDNARLTPLQECEADRLAANYLARAGYDPCMIVRSLDRVEARPSRDGLTQKQLVTDQCAVCGSAQASRSLMTCPPLCLLPARDPSDFKNAREEARAYDESFTRLFGSPLPKVEGTPPKLQHRSHRKRRGEHPAL